MNRRTLSVSGLIVIALALSACGTGAVEPTAQETTEPPYVSAWVAPAATELAPLSGDEVALGSLEHPSLAAKIDNHPSARPQFGLNRTDIVFEELVEGGMTRYVAVWHSDVPKVIGPVRSIRPMDPDIVSPLGGVIAYSGGQQKFVQMMIKTRVRNAIHGFAETEKTFYRSDAAPAPHNVHVLAREVIEDFGKQKAPAQQFAFSPDAASSTAAREGKETAGFEVRFSSSSTRQWTWSEKSGAWLRSQGGVKDVDEKGKRLQATNVIVMEVEISGEFGNVPRTVMIGKGQAWIATDGRYTKVRWSKASQNSPIVFTDSEGAAVRIATGNTWIELMPEAGSVSFRR